MCMVWHLSVSWTSLSYSWLWWWKRLLSSQHRVVCCGSGCDWCHVSAVRGEGGGIWAARNRNHQVCHVDTWLRPSSGKRAWIITCFPVYLDRRIAADKTSRSYPLQPTLQRCFLPLSLTKQKWDLVSFGCGWQDIISPPTYALFPVIRTMERGGRIVTDSGLTAIHSHNPHDRDSTNKEFTGVPLTPTQFLCGTAIEKCTGHTCTH